MAPEPWVARCDGVVKVYRGDGVAVEALRGVSATFPPAALTAVVGPSGSGKSSLLRLLAGMERATSGTIRVGPLELDGASGRRLRRLRRHTIGYVFQSPSDNFVSYLTVDEHLRMAAGRRSEGPGPGPVLEELGIGARAGHVAASLSGGQQQLAAFAQAVVGGATVVVADEPTAELDGASARLVLERMRLLIEDGVAFIVATHDRAVERVADRVIYLDEGRVRDRPARPAPSFLASALPGTLSAGPEGRILVHVRGANKSYRRGPETVHAVQGATLGLPAGTMVGLIGRSGSGKTTLLNLIAGWERPDEGTIDRTTIAGEGVVPGDGLSNGVPRWGRMAILPQRLGLMDELSVRGNVEYPARLAGVAEEAAPRVGDLLEALGLTDLADRYPRETSVGEQQRAALARALVLRPSVLLLDEPTGHQDHRSARLVLDLLREAAAEGTCCLVATHDEEAARNFDLVVRIEDGILHHG
ncbi:MAG: ATP-binding cassette domain-containing protein [Actinomycetota bacterium]